MKVEVRVSDNVTITAEGETHMDLFESLSELQEVFGEHKCGKCGGNRLKFVVRKVQDGKKEYKYPEMQCQDYNCRAKLTFGQMEGGKVYPVRYERADGEYVKDEHGNKKKRGNWGWVIYNPQTKQEE